MDKVRALYEYKEKGNNGKEYKVVEEVFILKFLDDGKNALCARKGEMYAPHLEEKRTLVGENDGRIVGANAGAKVMGTVTETEVMKLADLLIIDEKFLPAGVVWKETDKMTIY